jgi:hypothetical protein
MLPFFDWARRGRSYGSLEWRVEYEVMRSNKGDLNMKSRAFALLTSVAVLVQVSSGYAGEKVEVTELKVKSLPGDVYSKLAPGERLSLLYKSPEFDPSKGYSIGRVDYKAAERIGDILTYLKEQTQSMGTSGAPYTLDLTLTDADPGKSGNFKNNYGFVVIEGVVKKGDTPVAFFVSKEKGELGGFAITERPAVDRILSGIDGELFRAK